MHELPHGGKGKLMKKVNSPQKKVEMLDEYDFSRGVRGKYAARYAEGSNVVVLEPDVIQFFQNAKAVNQALRALAKIIRSQTEQKSSKRRA